MATIRLMHAKLHRVRVTDAKRDYVGSITIDQELLEKVGILPLEEVEIVNISNGNRWSTYALPGEAGTGCVCPNGGGALMCQPGDILIIFSYEWCDRTDVLRTGHTARVIVADEQNRCKEFFHQTLTPCEGSNRILSRRMGRINLFHRQQRSRQLAKCPRGMCQLKRLWARR